MTIPHPVSNGNGSQPVPGRSVALVHDYLLVMRGAERVFAAMADCWPAAPIYTLLYDESGTNGVFSEREVHSSYLNSLPVRQSGFRRLLPLFPRAAERLPVQSYDLVISSSSAFAHGVRVRPSGVHISYCYTPFRYAWHERERALEETPRLLRPIVAHMLNRIRAWDVDAARRTTHYIGISELSRQRIAEFWGRNATIVYPPVEVERFSIGSAQDYLLVVTELVRHKRVHMALEAARRAGRAIKVVGGGPELRGLREEFGASAEFLGRVSDEELADLYAGALALVVPGVEEFGIAAVEAQAAGRPVVAAAAGGVLETVIPGRTGVLVPPGDVDGLALALRETSFDSFDPSVIKAHAGSFSISAFKQRLTAEVERVCDEAAAQAAASPAYAGPSINLRGDPHPTGGRA